MAAFPLPEEAPCGPVLQGMDRPEARAAGPRRRGGGSWGQSSPSLCSPGPQALAPGLYLWPGACPIAPTLGPAHQVFEVLVDLLTVQQPEDRRLAAQLLGVRLDAAAVTALRVAARDTNASVRVQALNALGKLHDAQTPSRGRGRGRSCSRCLVGPARPKPEAHY